MSLGAIPRRSARASWRKRDRVESWQTDEDSLEMSRGFHNGPVDARYSPDELTPNESLAAAVRWLCSENLGILVSLDVLSCGS